VGFLIDTGGFAPGSDPFEELVDGVIAHNNQMWGGRTNPIIFFSGDSLTNEDWKQLESVDVDCVKAYGRIPPKLLAEMDERLGPWAIEEDDRSRGGSIGYWGIPVVPTPENLRFFDDRDLVVFDFAAGCEQAIQRLVLRNFGTYPQWFEQRTNAVRRNPLWGRLFSKIRIRKFLISDRKSLAAALLEWTGSAPGSGYQPPTRLLAPSELGSIFQGETWPTSPFSHSFQIIVGDNPADLAEHWNSVWWKRTWTRPYAHHLWLPTELAFDALMREPLRNWLRLYTGTGSSGAKVAEFVSNSLPATELEPLKKALCEGPWAPHGRVVTPQTNDERRRRVEQELDVRVPLVLSNTEDAVRYSANADHDTLSLQKPDLLADPINPDGVWMVDVQIEQVSPHRPTTPEQSWWLVPRRNSGGLVLSIFGEAGRVNRYGLFSVRVENQSRPYQRHVKPELKIHLPSQAEAVQLLIVRPRPGPVFTADVRYKKLTSTSIVHRVRLSEKGEHLQGLIQLFGDFWTAKHYCERRFWRQVFAMLANRDSRKDADLRQRITKLLQRKMLGVSPQSGEAEHLAGRIMGHVQGRISGVAMTYPELKHELDELAKTPTPNQTTARQGELLVCHLGFGGLIEEDMRRGLNDLVGLNLLRPGVYVRCSFCGVRKWLHIDEVKQEIHCDGCGHDQFIGAPIEWSYALNSVVQASVAQGQLAVINALAALASHPHQSFFYSPNLELFKEGSAEPWHEIDVAAVIDSEFVVGEVKEGQRKITKADFDELAEIAETLRPDRAIMFLLADNVPAEAENLLEQTRQRLSPKGIKAQIFQLPAL
jgi:hypothetical protein